MKKVFLFLIALILIFGKALGQAEKLDSILQLYNQNYQPEKIYIHFDKSVYAGGETIWFKAYLFEGPHLSNGSKNFYIDFFDVKGKLLKHLVDPVRFASSNGQFEIPTDYAGQFIHLKAYTKRMQNFDPKICFIKDIYVSQNAKLAKPAFVGSISAPITNLQFFPEGGDLVEGLYSKLAFLAADQTGKPMDIFGAITTAKGVFVDSFSSSHDGMGAFMIIPQPGETYQANWQDANGKKYTTALPNAQKNGMDMFIQPFNKKTIVQLNRTAEAGNDLKVLHLAAYMNQQLVYRARLNLVTKTSIFAEIPTDSLATGILQITVFDDQLRPHAERVVFVNNHNYAFTTNVAIKEKNLGKRAKNVVEIICADTIPANLSVSITDADLTTEQSNIFSQLLLCSDIKGFVRNPSYYFDSSSTKAKQDMDLVMLTHGWRRFNWDNALKGIPPVSSDAKDSDYIVIKGETLLPDNVKVALDQKLALILQAKDSTKQFRIIPVEKDGSFVLHGSYFFDTMRVFYNYLGDKKLERKSELTFQNGLLPPLANDLPVNYSSPFLWVFDNKVETQKAKNIEAQRIFLEKALKATMLQNVTVTAKAKLHVDVLDEKYTSGMFSGGDAKQFDLTDDQRTNGMYSIFQYLQGLVAGLQITQIGTDWGLRWRGETPELFLDEMRVDIQGMEFVPVTDIAYVKVFRPPFFGSPTGGGGAIAVYRRKASDIKPTTLGLDRTLNYKMLEGYSPIKQFYSPNYADSPNQTVDLRTTLFWKPYIITDAHNHTTTIEFFNNDISKRLRVIVEGVNDNGKMTRTEKVIE